MRTVLSGRPSRRGRLLALVPAVAVSAVVASVAGTPGAVAAQSASARPVAARTTVVPALPGYAPVAPPGATTVPKALPRKAGTVPVNRAVTVRALRATAARTAPRLAATTGAAAPQAVAAAAVTPQLTKTGLRALVVGTGAGDWGVDTWKQTLDQVGAAYDVLDASTTPLTVDSLVRPDGAGRYNAVLLTSSQLFVTVPDGNGGTVVTSALDGTEWNTLWAYERDYKVRQAALYTSYGSYPEDYCLTAGTGGAVGDTALPATLTSAGRSAMSYLRAGAQIPLVQSYVYRDRITPNPACTSASALLQNGLDVLGVTSTSADGRERMALTFTSNVNLLQSLLLPYGLFRWASHGLFLGDQRHSLNVDVDDWFNTSDLWVNGAVSTTQVYEMTASDALNAANQQSNLRNQFPLARQFTMSMAYNGDGAVLPVPSTSFCGFGGGTGALTSMTRCLRNQFRWINHTFTHPKMNATDYATNVSEIQQNLAVATSLGLPVPTTVLKTPEYSGLGVYDPAGSDINPPTDFGIMASNQALLDAAADNGITYLHGNMSFKSHQPPCFNCNLVHPMKDSISVVPDWPTNIAYFSNNPASETSFYNAFYGPNGKFPFWPSDRTYNQIVDYETELALRHLASGAIYTHTFHIANLDNYGNGRTLLTDWATALVRKYSSYYSVPLLNQGWPGLADYTKVRNAHFKALPTTDAVYDSATNTVTLSSATAGSVQVTGARAIGFTTYGSDSLSVVAVPAGTPVTVTAARLA